MVKSVHALLVGSGISGLTMANLLVHGNKKMKFRITLFEYRPYCGGKEENIGGGIGIWPPGQSVLRNIPNYEKFMEQFSYSMPFPSYRDPSGRVLARASDDFSERFPVQCLNRQDLIHFLAAGIESRADVEIITSQKIYGYERDGEQIVLKTDNNVYKGDLLIACDGIHSKIRNCLMAELQFPPVLETYLGYTYFRANTKIPLDTEYKWWSVSFETWGQCLSKKHGNYEIRFGYVPLKPPEVFWFIAIRTQKNHKYLSPINEIKLVDEETKQFLLDLVQSWQPIHLSPNNVAVNYEALINLTHRIIRTDIAKIKDVEKFPWTSKDNRVVLLGDAAHATAPNVAQGAGLCMEDAAFLVSKLNRVDYLCGITEYEQERKVRAATVQNVADFIAVIGQLKNPFLKQLRNGIMRTITVLSPSLQRYIFEYVVSYSLGGSRKSLYWQAPQLSITDDAISSLFAKAFPEFNRLDVNVKNFKCSPIGGSGLGVISVEKPQFFTKIRCFPKEMNQQPFYAEVINQSENVQLWRRKFAYKTSQQQTYTTSHSLYCDLKRHPFLSEGFGGFFDKIFRFIYKITQQTDKSLKYESQGITFFDVCKIPLPAFLLPKSVWTEKPIENGWKFDGKITYPLLGTLFHYFGSFQIEHIKKVKNKRAIIAGGSGMIGKEVCIEFIKKGYDVYCLSRSAKTRINIAGVKIRLINEDWSDLIDKNTLILNLSGANPGAKRWTASVKSNIANSRFRIIDTIIDNINRASEKPLKFLQASAAGFYGDGGDILLTEECKPFLGKEEGTSFRINVCNEIEQRAIKADCDVVNLRIGHVLSNNGGVLPYFKFAGLFYIGKFGTGNQFVPFVHIQDVARAMEFIASNDNIIAGAINIAAPQPCRNTEMLKALRWIKWGPGISLPESILKLIIGQSKVILTDSERVYPKRLLENGFKFDFNSFVEALHGLQ